MCGFFLLNSGHADRQDGPSGTPAGEHYRRRTVLDFTDAVELRFFVKPRRNAITPTLGTHRNKPHGDLGLRGDIVLPSLVEVLRCNQSNQVECSFRTEREAPPRQRPWLSFLQRL